MNKLKIILIITCLLLGGCNRVDHSKPETIITDDFYKNTEQDNNSVTSSMDSKNDLKDIMALKYETKSLEPSKSINEDEVNKIKDIILNDNTMVIYSKIGQDKDEHYIGIKLNDTLFEIGEIAYIDNIDVKEVIIGESTFIKVSGGLGANYPVDYYFTIENEEPIQYIHKELPIIIVDLDNDGTLEWVSNFDGLVAIYKMIDKEWKYVNLTKSMGIDLIFDEKEKKFYPRISSEDSYYVFKENTLLLHRTKKD